MTAIIEPKIYYLYTSYLLSFWMINPNKGEVENIVLAISGLVYL